MILSNPLMFIALLGMKENRKNQSLKKIVLITVLKDVKDARINKKNTIDRYLKL